MKTLIKNGFVIDPANHVQGDILDGVDRAVINMQIFNGKEHY